MTVDTEADLGLSLSLNLTQHKPEQQQQEYQLIQHQHHRQQQKQQEYRIQMQAHNVNNLFPNFFNSALQHKAAWNPFSSGVDHTQTHTSSMMRPSAETRALPKTGIDVNRHPTIEDYTDHDAGASSPNSTISSHSGKRNEREVDHPACSGSDDEDGDNSRKKLRLSRDQSAILEETFKDHNTLNPKQKMALAKQLGLRPRQVEVWFQNRRARTKLKQTEVDCEFLKRCCENLTEENRRLQKEVQELRALKLSPQFYMQMAPPTTLTMCPSCERVGGQSQSNNQSGRPKHHENHWNVEAGAFNAMIRPRS